MNKQEKEKIIVKIIDAKSKLDFAARAYAEGLYDYEEFIAESDEALTILDNALLADSMIKEDTELDLGDRIIIKEGNVMEDMIGEKGVIISINEEHDYCLVYLEDAVGFIIESGDLRDETVENIKEYLGMKKGYFVEKEDLELI